MGDNDRATDGNCGHIESFGRLWLFKKESKSEPNYNLGEKTANLNLEYSIRILDIRVHWWPVLDMIYYFYNYIMGLSMWLYSSLTKFNLWIYYLKLLIKILPRHPQKLWKKGHPFIHCSSQCSHNYGMISCIPWNNKSNNNPGNYMPQKVIHNTGLFLFQQSSVG